jgi:FkbM family methyltransferase
MAWSEKTAFRLLKDSAVWCTCLIGGFARMSPVLRAAQIILRWCDSGGPGGWRARLGSVLHPGFEPNIIRTKLSIEFRPKHVRMRGRFGERYMVDVNDHIGWNIFLRGYFDLTPIAIARVLDTKCPGRTYIDVGANIGSTSIPIAMAGIPSVAIEASPSVLRDLAANIALNSPLPLCALNLAASSPSDVASACYAEIHSPSGNAGASSLLAAWSPSRRASKVELARLATLDSVVASLGIDHIGLIKIDVEGTEAKAIAGLRASLERFRPVVLYEWRPDVSATAAIALPDVSSLFPDGYVFRTVSSRLQDGVIELTIAPFNSDRPSENVLAIPPDQGTRDLFSNSLRVPVGGPNHRSSEAGASDAATPRP